MLKKLVIISCCIFLVACDDEEDKAAERVYDTIRFNWDKEGVPLNDLVVAMKDCKTYPDLHGCERLHTQVRDISISLESCMMQSPKSKLCDEVVTIISHHPINNFLPKEEALILPNHPFYFSLPTTFLDAISSHYGYRSEMWNAWMQKYQLPLYKIIYGTMTTLVLWLFFIFCRSEKANQEKIERKRIADEQEAKEQKARDDKLKEQEAVAAVKQKIAEEAAAQKQNAAKEKLAEENRQREIEHAIEEARLVDEKQKADDAAAREAADKKQIEEMMKAAVKNLAKKK